jgi:hypothetical protein
VKNLARVCYVSGDGHGLALALEDEGGMNWFDAKTACEGKTPTVEGCTWKLATQDEWNLMREASAEHTALSLAHSFQDVGGINMMFALNYWSATEGTNYPDIPAAYALYIMDLTQYSQTYWRILDKNLNSGLYGAPRARACLVY